MKCPVRKTVFHSPEINNKIKLIELMAVCMEHILCETLIALLIFDFLNVIRKLRHIHVCFCDVRVLLGHVLFHPRHNTLLGKHFTSYVRQYGPRGRCCDRLVVGFSTTSAISAYQH